MTLRRMADDHLTRRGQQNIGPHTIDAAGPAGQYATEHSRQTKRPRPPFGLTWIHPEIPSRTLTKSGQIEPDLDRSGQI